MRGRIKPVGAIDVVILPTPALKPLTGLMAGLRCGSFLLVFGIFYAVVRAASFTGQGLANVGGFR
jgi:hypothetical protein